MSPRDHDPELRDLLSAGDSLHEQLARLDRSEPPEELDRIVIEHARQAIRTPAADRPIRQFRWAVPVALAATVLVSFALVMQIGPSGPAPAPAVEIAAARVDPEQPIPAQTRVEDPTEVRALTPPSVVVAPPVASVRKPADAPAAPQAYERSAASAENVASARAAPEAALSKREAQTVELQGTTAMAGDERADARNAAATSDELRADPDAWLAAIARLRQQGRHEEADREYAEYRRLYPHKKYGAPSPAGDVAPDR